jgi:hypothetical protein
MPAKTSSQKNCCARCPGELLELLNLLVPREFAVAQKDPHLRLGKVVADVDAHYEILLRSILRHILHQLRQFPDFASLPCRVEIHHRVVLRVCLSRQHLLLLF